MGSDLVRTGIPGLDIILHGGIPSTNVILVEGSSGSGKTLLGTEFIYRGITEFNEPGIIVIFEVSPAKLVRDAATLGWNLTELQAQKKLRIVFTSLCVCSLAENRSRGSSGIIIFPILSGLFIAVWTARPLQRSNGSRNVAQSRYASSA